jgi:thiamine monophosphate kinase
MIALIGGRYDGKYLKREKMRSGDIIAILDPSGKSKNAATYQMSVDGCAYPVDPRHRAWHTTALQEELS